MPDVVGAASGGGERSQSKVGGGEPAWKGGDENRSSCWTVVVALALGGEACLLALGGDAERESASALWRVSSSGRGGKPDFGREGKPATVAAALADSDRSGGEGRDGNLSCPPLAIVIALGRAGRPVLARPD